MLAGLAGVEVGLALFGNNGKPNRAKASCVADVAANTFVKSVITNEQTTNVKNRIENRMNVEKNKGLFVFATQCNTAVITNDMTSSQNDTTKGVQSSHITSTIDQTAQALSEGAASGAQADTKTVIKEVLNTYMSSKEDDNQSCEADSDTRMVMNANDNDGTLGVSLTQSNYAAIHSTASCVQKNIENNIQRSVTESDITQKADSKAKGASFGDLFSGIFGVVGIVVVVAVVASVGMLGLEWVRICLLVGFVSLYALCIVMTLLKYFGTGSDDDAANSVKSCENNKKKYEQASGKYILSAPFCFRVPHPGNAQPPAPAGYKALPGYPPKPCNVAQIEETMRTVWKDLNASAPSLPIAGIWCRKTRYEHDVISDFHEWLDQKEDNESDNQTVWQQFYILQQIGLEASATPGTLHLYIVDEHYPSKDTSVYAWCTSDQKPGLSAVKPQYPIFARPGGSDGSGNAGYNIDPDKDRPFSYLPFPMPKCVENGMSEQSVNVMCEQTGGPIPFTQTGDPDDCHEQKDQVMLPNVSGIRTPPLDAIDKTTTSAQPVQVYMKNIPEFKQYINSYPTDIFLAKPKAEDIATWDDRNNATPTDGRNGSCFPAWIFGSKAVMDSAGFETYSNTIVYGFVQDRNEYQPVGQNYPDDCMTYGEAMDAKKSNCVAQIIIYLVVCLSVLVLQFLFTFEGYFGLLDVTFVTSCGVMVLVGGFLGLCGYEGYETIKSEL